jgi:hypothetical protein
MLFCGSIRISYLKTKSYNSEEGRALADGGNAGSLIYFNMATGAPGQGV